MIVYTCIARADDAVVLVESQTPELAGNAGQVTRKLLEYIRYHPEYLNIGDRKTWYAQNEATKDLFETMVSAFGYSSMDGTEHFFHCYKQSNVIYCCLSDDYNPKDQKVNFDYLDRIHQEFTTKFTQDKIDKAKEGGMSKRFTKNIRSASHYYNVNHEKLARETKVDDLMYQVESLKEVLGRNIALALKREEDLDNLVRKSEEMSQGAQVFQKQSVTLKHKIVFASATRTCALVIMVLGGIYMITAMLCGFKLDQCRAQNNGGN